MNNSPSEIIIVQSVYEEMIQHARRNAPLECCGLLSGEEEVITQIHPATNCLHSPSRYSIDPHELFLFFRKLRHNGQQHLGIYHSHPRSEAYPSATDVEEAFYPHCSYFIVSLENPSQPQVRAFRIIEQGVWEMKIRFVAA